MTKIDSREINSEDFGVCWKCSAQFRNNNEAHVDRVQTSKVGMLVYICCRCDVISHEYCNPGSWDFDSKQNFDIRKNLREMIDGNNPLKVAWDVEQLHALLGKSKTIESE